MNALKHGLRARSFGLLPEESKAEWAEHMGDLRSSYRPRDGAEEKLVTALAAAMWLEIRADRTLVETMAEIPPVARGRSHGTDLQDPRHAAALGTALRYQTAAGMATQRALRALLTHRKAVKDGLVPAAADGRRGRNAGACAAARARQSELHERIPRPARTRAACARARRTRAWLRRRPCRRRRGR